jgi:hypothetical protein
MHVCVDGFDVCMCVCVCVCVCHLRILSLIAECLVSLGALCVVQICMHVGIYAYMRIHDRMRAGHMHATPRAQPFDQHDYS